MQEIAISEFKARCLALLEEVSKTGKPIRITRRGKPIAEVVPPSPATKRRKLGSMSGTVKILGDIVAPVISRDFMKQIKNSKRPVVLTVKGKAVVVVQDAEAYPRLLDIAAGANAEEGIRQGLEDVKKSRVRPVREFVAEFESRRGIRR